MKFNKHQQLIIKKIASGEITDISTYLKVFDLSTYRKLDENDILNRLNESEKGNCYKPSIVIQDSIPAILDKCKS